VTSDGDTAGLGKADDVLTDSDVAAVILQLPATPPSASALAAGTAESLQRQAERQLSVRLEE
jgi:hypothetical protein